MVLAQTDAAAIEVMERIATSQYIMTIVMVIMLIMAAGGALIFMMEFGKLRKLMRDTSILMDELKRVAVPLIEGAAVTVSEAAKITTEMHTRFGQVLDVVQTETEELLLDAAATAHGVHETARMLREPRPRRVVRRPTEIELDPDEDLGGWDDRTR
jgi:hypothetical protein